MWLQRHFESLLAFKDGASRAHMKHREFQGSSSQAAQGYIGSHTCQGPGQGMGYTRVVYDSLCRGENRVGRSNGPARSWWSEWRRANCAMLHSQVYVLRASIHLRRFGLCRRSIAEPLDVSRKTIAAGLPVSLCGSMAAEGFGSAGSLNRPAQNYGTQRDLTRSPRT